MVLFPRGLPDCFQFIILSPNGWVIIGLLILLQVCHHHGRMEVRLSLPHKIPATEFLWDCLFCNPLFHKISLKAAGDSLSPHSSYRHAGSSHPVTMPSQPILRVFAYSCNQVGNIHSGKFNLPGWKYSSFSIKPIVQWSVMVNSKEHNECVTPQGYRFVHGAKSYMGYIYQASPSSAVMVFVFNPINNLDPSYACWDVRSTFALRTLGTIFKFSCSHCFEKFKILLMCFRICMDFQYQPR